MLQQRQSLVEAGAPRETEEEGEHRAALGREPDVAAATWACKSDDEKCTVELESVNVVTKYDTECRWRGTTLIRHLNPLLTRVEMERNYTDQVS